MRYLRYLSVCLQSGFWTINSMLGVAIWSHIEFNQAYSCHHSNVCTIAQYYPTNWHQELILHPPKLNIAKYQKMMGFGQSISGFHYQLFWKYSYVKFPLVTSPHQKKKNNMFSHQSYPTTVAGILNNPLFGAKTHGHGLWHAGLQVVVTIGDG